MNVMNLLENFMIKAKDKSAKIGIGLGNDYKQNLKIIQAVKNFNAKRKITVYLFGKKGDISKVLKELNSFKNKIRPIESRYPEKIILDYLKNNKINAIIRGNLNSSTFLQYLKDILKISKINRLAILETINKYQFFFGPVGIDECNNFQKKIDFINQAITLFEIFNIEPRVSILSGGRLNDINRDNYVDQTIDMAQKVVSHFKNKNPKLNIQHHEILIEKGIENNSNLIIAPDGISGNLIYRTLVHLGGGKAYGAIYMGLDYVIIDTSRVGKISEIEGALILALALNKDKN